MDFEKADWRPSNLTNIFALDSDYAMGAATRAGQAAVSAGDGKQLSA